MNNHKAIAFFRGFPDRRFTDEIAGRLEKELPVRRCIVFITACPVDYQQNDEDSAGMLVSFTRLRKPVYRELERMEPEPLQTKQNGENINEQK